MVAVNGLCVSVLNDAYHFCLTTSASPPETIQVHAPFKSTVPDTIAALSSKFANLNPSDRTIFCLPSTASTVQLRCIMNIVRKLRLLDQKPIKYRQAYVALSVSASDCPTAIHFLECSQASSETEIREFSFDPERSEILEGADFRRDVIHKPGDDAPVRAEKVVRELVAPLRHSTRTNTKIVILNAQQDMIDALRPALAAAKPDIPVHVISSAELSAGAARYDPPVPRTKTTAVHVMPLPVSVATADGSAVVVVPWSRKIRPAQESVLFSTSTDNQSSASLSIYLGDHLKAEDNLLSGKVTLDNLIQVPKGEARIRASFTIGLETATVTVEQVLNEENVSPPKVVAEFPDFINYLSIDYERYRCPGRRKGIVLRRYRVACGRATCLTRLRVI